ncbi:MAG: hypothetical protein GXP47_10765 [Acidobacteria bacterium]|nr:hypothetical protein [Acidobacteriota bacterium]
MIVQTNRSLLHPEPRRGRMEDARRYLLRACRLYRTNPEVWEALARLAEEGGHPELAGRYTRKAMLRRRAGPGESGEPEGGVRPR